MADHQDADEEMPSPYLLLDDADDPTRCGPEASVLLGTDGVSTARQELAQIVAEVLSVTADDAALLLASCGWDASAACEAACEDYDAAMKRAGVAVGTAATATTSSPGLPSTSSTSSTSPSSHNTETTPMPTLQNSTSTSSSSTSSSSSLAQPSLPFQRQEGTPSPSPTSDEGDGDQADEVFTCPVCCSDDVPARSLPRTPCGHAYCSDCWGHYVSGKMADGEFSAIRCMEPSCAVVVPPALVRGVVDPAQYERYASFQARSFVERNRLAAWCPAPGCDNAVVLGSSGGLLDVACACGHRFCFRCNGEPHAPASCDRVSEWAKQCESDGETCKWLRVNTKDCPKCGVAVEKNGGCQHMSCSRCGHQYCWLCMKDWRGHTNCNRYETADEVRDREQARNSLQRYVHYYDRFERHARALAREPSLRADAAERALDAAGTCSAEVLPRAVDCLVSAHQVLKYSYVYAFYLHADSRHKDMFEHLQGISEEMVSELEAALETFDASEADEGRITHMTSTISRVIANLLGSASDGDIVVVDNAGKEDKGKGPMGNGTAAGLGSSSTSKKRFGKRAGVPRPPPMPTMSLP